MAFDKPTRNALSRMVADCRRLLTDDVREQLQATYGIQPDGTALEANKLAYLDDRGLEIATALREWLAHLCASEAGTEEQRRKNAFFRMAQETAFTYLNRLAALRMCEERGLVIECVRRGTESDGFALYERLASQLLGDRGQTYRVFLECMFDEMAVDLGVLFDRRVPHSLVFPTPACMAGVLQRLNNKDLTPLWKEDETIGWIYQDFNAKEEREAMRKASQAPQNSRELAVRNQFFTPRYVVEFLTDNTLGRIWYEMQQGETILRDQCRYLVRHPNEIFLGPEEQPPETESTNEDLSQEALLTRPVHIPHRAKKDPRDLKILDPACGSGHFLLYAFDLLEDVYIEAWQDEAASASDIAGKPLRDNYETEQLLRKDIPGLILKHNLHGIDIDPRACQIAALSLWLRAQRSYQKHGLKAVDRPKILSSNIVCAEPMPGEKDLLEEFIVKELSGTPEKEAIAHFVRQVFDKMQLAGEAGALLKIEEDISEALTNARKQWARQYERARDKKGSDLLFSVAEMDRISGDSQQRLGFANITDVEFWDQAEQRIVRALRDFAEHAANGESLKRGLFSGDAAQGFAFIDACQKRYDVVLMNPPFGDASKPSLTYLDAILSVCGRDVGAAFIMDAVTRLCPVGLVGAVLPTPPWFKPVFESWREATFMGGQSRLRLAAHLGGQVLDRATVAGAALVFDHAATDSCVVFRTVHAGTDEDNAEAIRESVDMMTNGASLSNTVYHVTPRHACVLPGKPFAYWVSQSLRSRLSQLPTLEGTGATIKQGTATADELRFGRAWWEVPSDSALWQPYTKSSEYSPYWDDIAWVGKFGDELRELRATGRARVQGVEYFSQPGVTFPSKAVLGFNARLQPSGSAFGHSGSVAFPLTCSPLALLAYLGSRPVEYVLSLFLGGMQGEPGVHPNHYEVGTIQRLPWPKLTEDELMTLETAAKAVVEKLQNLSMSDETSRLFLSPILDRTVSFLENAETFHATQATVIEEIAALRRSIDPLVVGSLGFIERDVEEMESEFQQRFPPAKGRWRIYFGESWEENRTAEYGQRFVSWLIGCAFDRWIVGDCMNLANGLGKRSVDEMPSLLSPAMRLRRDKRFSPETPQTAILTTEMADNTSENDLVARIRTRMGDLWGQEEAVREQDICAVLGSSQLRTYIHRPNGFFDFHVSLYSKFANGRRKAPIYWPLSTASGSYTIWLYYHRLNDQTIYTIVNQYIEAKIDDVQRTLARVKEQLRDASGADATRLRDELYRLHEFQNELQDMKQELLRVAALPYKPDLNDGVIINAAPLYKLFQHRSWAKDCADCWKKLEKGDYDWSQMAFNIWPERVREACKKDRSLAIAHGLEDICEAPLPGEKKQRKRSKSKT